MTDETKNETQDAERMFDTFDLRVRYSCTDRTVRNWVTAGDLVPSIYVNGQPRYTREAIQAFEAMMQERAIAYRAAKSAKAREHGAPSR